MASERPSVGCSAPRTASIDAFRLLGLAADHHFGARPLIGVNRHRAFGPNGTVSQTVGHSKIERMFIVTTTELVAKTTDRQRGCRSNATISQSAQRSRIERMFKARTVPACRHERGPVYADMEANPYTEESISTIERRPITSTPAVRGYRSWPE